MNSYLIISLTVILFIATLTDIRSHRIPNWLIYPSVVAGLGYHSYMNGMQGLLFSAEGTGMGILLLIFFYLTGGMGAGDVKLMGAVGSFLGPGGVLMAFYCTGIIGGIYALIVITRNGHLINFIKRYGLMLKAILVTHKLIYVPPRREEKMPALCYGAVIALGTSIAVLGIL